MRNVKIALEILGKANFEDVWSEISKNREKNVLLEKIFENGFPNKISNGRITAKSVA